MKTSKFILIFLFLIYSIPSFSQLNLQWQDIQCEGINCVDRYWGLDIYDDFIMASGFSYEPPPYNSNAFLVKYDLNGNVIWKSKNRRVGTQDYDFTKTDDQNNIYAVGMATHPPTVGMITKYSPKGDTIWNYFQTPTQNYSENFITSVVVSGNNIYHTSSVLNSNFYYDVVMQKLDASNGSLVWEKQFPLNLSYWAYSTLHTDNSGNIYLGIDKIYKFDTNGNVVWTLQNRYGSLQYDPNNNSLVYLTIEVNSDTSFKFFIEKIDLNANLIWRIQIAENENINHLALSNSSNMYVVRNGNKLIKLSSSGQIVRETDILNLESHSSYALDKYENLFINRLYDDFNNNMVDIRSVQYDSSGNFINDNSITMNWKMSYPSIKIDVNGFLYLYGRILYPEPNRGAVAVKFSTSVSIANTSSTIPEKFNLYQNYPNPFNPETNIKFDINKNDLYSLEIYDITGRLIEKLFEGFLNAGSYEVTFKNNNLASGIYLYRLKSDNFTQAKKMIISK